MLHTTNLAALLAVAALAAAPACKFPYPADVPDEDAATSCEPSTTTCSGATLTTCDAAGNATNTTCSFGCFSSGDRCADLDPSNGLATYLDQAVAAPDLQDVTVLGLDIDTTAVTINGAPPSFPVAVAGSPPNDIVVLIARRFEVKQLTAHGRRALAIVADRGVTLGSITVGAPPGGLGFRAASQGAGARTASDPECTAERGTYMANTYGGAGGGGHGTPGGDGGNGGSAHGGMGGASVGTERIEPLRGGCPGVNRTVMSPAPDSGLPQGGSGGGAIQISTRGSITIEVGAQITASGTGAVGVANGAFQCDYPPGGPDGCNAGSGGGAGGAILLEASSINFLSNNVVLSANGGGGSCGLHEDGRNGLASAGQATGLDCSSLAGVGSGGLGGAANLVPTRGGNGTESGGGGGGAAGRIRVNLPSGAMLDQGPVVSPTPSLGRVGVR